MIRVRKGHPPERLQDGEIESRRDCDAYNANRSDYENSTRKFRFKQNIYGHESVKAELAKSQHGKCCYCENKFKAAAPGDVEHYRPKAAVQQDKDSQMLTPGYFWLAYSWENLYFCCAWCNRTYKKNLFPLCDHTRRARSFDDNLEDEVPLILDPGGQKDPRNHIKFHEELAISNTEFGKKTIESIGLNRGALKEARLEHLDVVRTFLDVICYFEHPLPVQLTRVNSLLNGFVQPTAKFSAMTDDFLRAHDSRHPRR